jgi:hypothetical protein
LHASHTRLRVQPLILDEMSRASVKTARKPGNASAEACHCDNRESTA